MVLSENAVATLVATSRYDASTGKRRVAREAVAAAAKELGFEPLAPPLPRYGTGEDTLAAAVRVLKLTRAEKALAEYRVRRDALEQVEARYAALARREHELVLVERGRLHDQITAGRVPDPSPRKARDELAEVRLELGLVGSAPLEPIYPFRPDNAVRAQAITPEEWLGVVFYVHVMAERLLVLTEEESHRSQARMQALGAATPATGYERRLNNRLTIDVQEHYVAVRGIRLAVEAADLHLLHERRERTIEELAADTPTARSRRPASV